MGFKDSEERCSAVPMAVSLVGPCVPSSDGCAIVVPLRFHRSKRIVVHKDPWLPATNLGFNEGLKFGASVVCNRSVRGQ